jgi:hypothetical protein
MSKYLRIPYGDYKIEVQDGGRITLDTGTETGEVVITGDLTVNGTTTTVNSTELTVDDNIIVLNEGENGSGVTLNISGIEIDRGAFPSAQIVYNENMTDRLAGLPGMFQFTEENDGGRFSVGLVTNYIDTKGQNLHLYTSGLYTVKVDNGYNYEEQVFHYDDPAANSIDVTLGARDDDTIPNTKSIIDYVDSYFAGVFQDRIEEGALTKTFVETQDREETGAPSVVKIGVDDKVVAEFYDDKIELNNLRLFDTRIETTTSNEDLILSAPGTGTVSVRDVLEISKQPTLDDPSLQPTTPTNGLRLYIDERGLGGTGLYFVHEDTVRDEIISNNRTLVYSMIF